MVSPLAGEQAGVLRNPYGQGAFWLCLFSRPLVVTKCHCRTSIFPEVVIAECLAPELRNGETEPSREMNNPHDDR